MTLNPKIEEKLLYLKDNLILNKDDERILKGVIEDTFEAGRLQGLNEALEVMPRKDEVEFKEALLTWSIRIKSLIDKK